LTGGRLTNGGAPPIGPWWTECTALKGEQLDDGNVGLILQVMNAGQCRKWDDKSWDQHGMEAPLKRVATGMAGTKVLVVCLKASWGEQP
jgi:hypothetical protein